MCFPNSSLSPIHMYVILCRKSLKHFVRSYENFFRKHVHMYANIVVNLSNTRYNMAALNKHALKKCAFGSRQDLRRRRRRRRNKKGWNFKKSLWIRPTNVDRLTSGAFYSTLLVVKSLDRREFFK